MLADKNVDASFAELLVFITGADRPPIQGFERKISIVFYELEDGIQRMPSASTCALELSLPSAQNPDAFRRTMMAALRESYGFGKM